MILQTSVQLHEYLPSLSAGAGAVMGSLASYLQLRTRVRKLERRLTAVLRLLLLSTSTDTTAGLTLEQRGLLDQILLDTPE